MNMPVSNKFSFSEMLSQLLLAFTIEHDNEWEASFWLQTEHKLLRTSLVMWQNFLRFVPSSGITVGELSTKAGYEPKKIHPDFAGMLRWGYIHTNSKDPKKPKTKDVITVSEAGLAAAKTWRPLANEIEKRWQKRFGVDVIAGLRQLLIDSLQEFTVPLPHYFPCLQHRKGMRVSIPHEPQCDPIETLSLPSLLSQLHLLFTIEAEKHSELSLAIRFNVLRVLSASATAMKELPKVSGISKEAMVMCCNFLKKQGLAKEVKALGGRGKAIELTEAGLQKQAQTAELVAATEQTMQQRIGTKRFKQLKSNLQQLTGSIDQPNPLLTQALQVPNPKLWRATLQNSLPLARHPMVLYRGGWPDGS